MPEPVAKEIQYTQIYRHSLDEKKRVAVPFRWRTKDEEEFTLVIWTHPAGDFLRVLPPAEWQKLNQQLDAIPPKDPNRALMKRHIASVSHCTNLDKANRLTIPEEMAIAAGLTNQAVLAGALNRFEIWSPERHAQMAGMESPVAAQGMKDFD